MEKKERLEKVYSYIRMLGVKINSYSAKDIKSYLLKMDELEGGKYIDFISYCETDNEKIRKKKGKNGTYYANLSAINWIKKFVGDSININEINKKFLIKFEEYLISNEVGTAGISAILRAMRAMFVRATEEYNDESKDEFFIKHYPFKNFKIKKHTPTHKRSTTIETIKKIYNFVPKTKREEIGKDMFILSFLFAGIAPIDLYCLKEIKNGYIEYYREKVKFRENKIRLKIPVCQQAENIVIKYSKTGFLSEIKKYSTPKDFSRACNKGLKSICEKLNIETITLYWARHTFATIAAELGFDSNLIDFTLGHAPRSNQMAEIYITRRQNSVDKLINEVILNIHNLCKNK
ncbi:MAG: site-specific integrase [Lentimicrobiaceae bacterium]|jgi:integrase|nr:site-specific integrase [Lentimicrobiaceae bacterium]